MYEKNQSKFTSDEPEGGFIKKFLSGVGARFHHGAPYMYVLFGFVDVRTIRNCFR